MKLRFTNSLHDRNFPYERDLPAVHKTFYDPTWSGDSVLFYCSSAAALSEDSHWIHPPVTSHHFPTVFLTLDIAIKGL